MRLEKTNYLVSAALASVAGAFFSAFLVVFLVVFVSVLVSVVGATSGWASALMPSAWASAFSEGAGAAAGVGAALVGSEANADSDADSTTAARTFFMVELRKDEEASRECDVSSMSRSTRRATASSLGRWCWIAEILPMSPALHGGTLPTNPPRSLT